MDNTKRIISTSILQDIADSIRAKSGTSGEISVNNFSTEISNIPSGGGTSGVELSFELVEMQENIKVSTAGGVQVGNYLYIFGGRISGAQQTIYKINLSDGTVTLSNATLPNGTGDGLAFNYGKYIYFFGASPNWTSKMAKYDIEADTLTTISTPVDFCFSAIGIKQNKAYIIGGSYTTANERNTIYTFDLDTNQFTVLGTTFPVTISRPLYKQEGDILYVFGGSQNKSFNGDIYAFDMNTETTTKLNSTLPTAFSPTSQLGNICVATLGNYFYFLYGRVNYRFDLNDGSFTEIENFTTDFLSCKNVVAQLSNKAFAYGKYDSTADKTYMGVYTFSLYPSAQPQPEPESGPEAE